jgi:lysozyme
MTLYLGVDIARVDGNAPVNWLFAAKAGVKFAFFRGAWHEWADSTFKNEAKRARDAGVTVGAYLLPGFDDDPEQELDAFQSAADVKAGRDFVPVLDVEFPGGIKKTGKTRTELLASIVEFVIKMRERFGASPMIYTSARVWDGEDDDALNADALLDGVLADELHACPLWLARYPFKTNIEAVGDDAGEKPRVDAMPMPPVPKAWGDGNVWIHQYQGDAIKMPGFSRTVDLNRFFAMSPDARGPSVEWVQKKLGLALDGVYDHRMLIAVKKFQSENALVADGIIGPKTFGALCWR